MTQAELEVQILDAMAAEGLLPDVDVKRSMFLDVGDRMHTHVVLSDATRLSEARRVVTGQIEGLKASGITVEAIVRGAWSLRDVEYVGHWYGPNGELMTSVAFRVELLSGKRAHTVTVAVTYQAFDIISQAAKQESTDPSKVRSNALEVVRRFVEWYLSHGGQAYWDPIDYDWVELNATTAEILLHQMKAALRS